MSQLISKAILLLLFVLFANASKARCVSTITENDSDTFVYLHIELKTKFNALGGSVDYFLYYTIINSSSEEFYFNPLAIYGDSTFYFECSPNTTKKKFIHSGGFRGNGFKGFSAKDTLQNMIYVKPHSVITQEFKIANFGTDGFDALNPITMQVNGIDGYAGYFIRLKYNNLYIKEGTKYKGKKIFRGKLVSNTIKF